MQHCVKGREMLKGLQRAEFLPPWDEDGIRVVSDEMLEQSSNLTDNDSIPHKVHSAYQLKCIERNGRYLNSYAVHRLAKIRSLRWVEGTVLPEHITREILSPRENDYFTNYNVLIAEYNDAIKSGTSLELDLSSELQPPKDLLIEIRVLQECGEIMTESGVINLEMGSTHFVRRADVEHLIRQSKVLHIQSDGM